MTDAATTPDVPIACTLEADALLGRMEAWKAFVRSSVVAIEREPAAVRLVLAPGDTPLLDAATLGQREKACCAFFEIALVLGADARRLSLSVPPGAEETLTHFVEAITRD
jgi:hypothetical protein